MSAYIGGLTAILSEEAEIYKVLVEIAGEKKQVIIDGRIKDLERLTMQEQTLASKLMKLEQRRSEEIEKIMQREGIMNVNTVSDLANKLDPISREELNKSKGELIGLISDLKEKNDLNGSLIEQSLQFIKFNLSIIADVEEDNKYSKMNRDHKVLQKKNIFDVKV